MKKIFFLCLIVMGMVQPVKGDMCFDIVNNIIFSEPEDPAINPYKYEEILVDMIEIFEPYLESLDKMSDDEKSKDFIALYTYFDDYLSQEGSPEALRLCKDIEKLLHNVVNLMQNNSELYQNLIKGSEVMRLKHFGIKYKVCKNLNAFNKPK